uniref:Transposase n=1 Tax=Angiostrongylus cantonensis TaxID=6313 RepID=A0A0K0DMF7_ANGCA
MAAINEQDGQPYTDTILEKSGKKLRNAVTSFWDFGITITWPLARNRTGESSGTDETLTSIDRDVVNFQR